MADNVFTPDEAQKIRELFGLAPEQLSEEAFRKSLRELRARYHPDNFEKFGDDTVRQLATERFQTIERLAVKIEPGSRANSCPENRRQANRSSTPGHVSPTKP